MLYKHLYFRGVFSVRAKDTPRFLLYHPGNIIENEIFWRGLYGSWESDSLRIWAALVEHSEEVLDVGANTGVYSILAKAVKPQVVVHSFEPNSKYYPVILKNSKINRFDIKAYKYGLGDSDREGLIEDYSGEEGFIKASLRSIDSLITDCTIRKVDAMKLDVEFFELEVLRGFSKYIQSHRPAIIIEVLNDDVGKSIDEIVSGLGYLKYNISERGSIRQTELVLKSDYWNYLLCTPEQSRKIGLNNEFFRGTRVVHL